MTENSSFRTKDPKIQLEYINRLEQEFTTIVQLLYTSTVSGSSLERQVLPYVAENILFKDPLTESIGKQSYYYNLSNFHKLSRFTVDTFQVNVKLNENGQTGTCIVDGAIKFKQFSWMFTYPLRAILKFEFRLLNNEKIIDGIQFEIFQHEEMWSVRDMIDAIPGIGWCYKNIFRRGFTYLFVGVSTLNNFIQDRRAR